MKQMTIGVHAVGPTAGVVVERIAFAEVQGIECAWMVSTPVSADPLVIFGAAAMRTQRIRLGTSVIPTFPRHPLVLIQQAMGVDDLAPGRLRLGVGPSHKPPMEGMYGIPFEKPQEHLREYLTVLRKALHEGQVNWQGKRIVAHTKIGKPRQVPVLASALRPNGFRLCGELSDGAISWMCPLPYLRDVAAPALAEGARAAGRPTPPLIGHVPVVVSEDVAAVREATRKQVGFYPSIPYYSQMLQDAGFPEAKEGQLSDRMIDALVVHGTAEQVKARLRTLPSYGVNELLAMMIEPKNDAQAFERTVQVLGELASESASRA